MPNIIIVDDSFTGLALDAAIAGRVPTVSPNGASWAVDPNSSAIVGGGDGDVKFSVNGAAAKNRSGLTNCAVQLEITSSALNESYLIFLRDPFNTPYPRRGYFTSFNPASNWFSFGYIQEYNRTYLDANGNIIPQGGNTQIPWTFVSGLNTIALEAIDTTFRVIINNQHAYSTNNSVLLFDSNANKSGFVCDERGSGIARVKRYSVFDSIDTAPAQQYPVVFFG